MNDVDIGSMDAGSDPDDGSVGDGDVGDDSASVNAPLGLGIAMPRARGSSDLSEQSRPNALLLAGHLDDDRDSDDSQPAATEFADVFQEGPSDDHADTMRELAEMGEIDGADLEAFNGEHGLPPGWDEGDLDEMEEFEFDDELENDGFGELGRMVRPMSPSEGHGETSEGVMYDPSRGLISVYDSGEWQSGDIAEGSHGRLSHGPNARAPLGFPEPMRPISEDDENDEDDNEDDDENDDSSEHDGGDGDDAHRTNASEGGMPQRAAHPSERPGNDAVLETVDPPDSGAASDSPPASSAAGDAHSSSDDHDEADESESQPSDSIDEIQSGS